MNAARMAFTTATFNACGSVQAPELNDWSKKCFRRILVDMHIPDWDGRFLSKLEADTYVKTVAKGKSGGIMLYCNSHVGPTLYPSKLRSERKTRGLLFSATDE